MCCTINEMKTDVKHFFEKFRKIFEIWQKKDRLTNLFYYYNLILEPAKHKKTMSAGFESKVKVRQENTIGGNQMAGIKEECGVFGIYDLMAAM